MCVCVFQRDRLGGPSGKGRHRDVCVCVCVREKDTDRLWGGP